mmetsp:Transcript_32552/g.62893  ORF Transcript_32552/g.62893 Transcript_32552/m.62893 type:complete len:163 (-) Transcript_32552:35-523(-)
MKLNVSMDFQVALSAPPGLPQPPEFGQRCAWASDNESETHADTSSRTTDSDDYSDPEQLQESAPTAPMQTASGAKMNADAPEFFPVQGTSLNNEAEAMELVPGLASLAANDVRTRLRSVAPSFVPHCAWQEAPSCPFGPPPGLRPALRSGASSFVPRIGLMG